MGFLICLTWLCVIPKPKSIPSLYGLGLFLWSWLDGHGIILFSHFSAPRAGRCELPTGAPDFIDIHVCSR